MQAKPKRSRRNVLIFLFLGIVFWVILVGAVSVISLLSLGQVITFNGLFMLHTSYPAFFFIDVFALINILLFAWVGWERDRLRDAKKQAEWVVQNQKLDFQKEQEIQVEAEKKYQEEINQVNEKLEAAIRRGKQQWEGTFDAVSDLILLTDGASSILRCNRATGEAFQIGHNQILGRGIDDLFMNDSKSLQGMTPGEAKQIKVPQAAVCYEISKNHLLIDGKQEGWVYIFRNITAQKHALLEQKRLTQYYELLVNNSPVAIVTLNLEDRIIDCNPAFERMFQYNKRESLGWKADLLISPKDLVYETRGMVEAVRKGETVHKVTQRKRKDGSLLDVEVFGIPVILEGKQFGSLSLFHDVSELVHPKKVEPEPGEVKQATSMAAKVVMAKIAEEAIFSKPRNKEPVVATFDEEVEPVLPEEGAAESSEGVVEVTPLEIPVLEEEEVEQFAELQPIEDEDGASAGPPRKRLIPIEKIEGIGPVYGQKLVGLGVKTTEDLLDQGKTRKGREELVEKTGISSTLMLRWVNMADLMRIRGIGEEYSELLEKAGVDTVKELRNRNPKNLYEAMLQANEACKLVRRTPHLSEVENWIKEAKELEPVLTY